LVYIYSQVPYENRFPLLRFLEAGPLLSFWRYGYGFHTGTANSRCGMTSETYNSLTSSSSKYLKLFLIWAKKAFADLVAFSSCMVHLRSLSRLLETAPLVLIPSYMYIPVCVWINKYCNIAIRCADLKQRKILIDM